MSSSPQSRSPSPEGEQLSPSWPGPPPCPALEEYQFLGPWAARPGLSGGHGGGRLQQEEGPGPRGPPRTPRAHGPGWSRRTGPAQPSWTRKGGKKARSHSENPRAWSMSAGVPPRRALLVLWSGLAVPPGKAGRTQKQPLGFGGSSCQLGFRADWSAGGGASDCFRTLRGRWARGPKYCFCQTCGRRDCFDRES